MAVNRAKHVALVLLSLLSVLACEVLDGGSLVRAYDAALSNSLKSTPISSYQQTFSKLPLLQLLTCNSDPKYFPFPSESTDNSLLSGILKRNVLRVGAVLVDSPAGNYTSVPPSGFLPMFMVNVLHALNEHYRPLPSDPKIIVQWSLYATETEVMSHLESGDIDVTDQNFQMDVSDGGVARTTKFTASCTAFAYTLYFSVRNVEYKDINAVKKLVNHLYSLPEDPVTVIRVGTTSAYIKSLANVVLPRKKGVEYQWLPFTTDADMLIQVVTGNVDVVLSETHYDDPKLNTFDSEIVTMRAAFFRRSIKFPGGGPKPDAGRALSLLSVLALVLLQCLQ